MESVAGVLERIISEVEDAPRVGKPAEEAPPPSQVLRAQFTTAIRSVDEQTRTITFVASTEAKDRYGDIIRTSGWKLDNYKKNPVFLLSHQSREFPVGKAVSIQVEPNPPALVIAVQFADAATYQLADTAFRLYKGGFLRAVSVGFVPLASQPILDDSGMQTGREFTQQELLELSAVAIPANPEALARAVESGDFDDEEVDEILSTEGKAVCPYSADPIAPAGTTWDAAAAMATAHDPAGWRRMCTVIVGDPKNKTSYKLPHHDGPNQKWRIVPNGVRAALGRLEKTQMASTDRPGARSHLMRHQKAIAAAHGISFGADAFEARLAALGEAYRSAEAASLPEIVDAINEKLDEHIAGLDRLLPVGLDGLLNALVQE